MPKVNITFDLPDEEFEYNQVLNAKNYYNIITTLQEELRKARKYSYFNSEQITLEEERIFDKIEDYLCELIDENEATF